MQIQSVDAFDIARLCAQAGGVAAAAERRLLSRELHDGIAQDLASLGYAVDDLALDQCDHSHQADLIDLRAQLTQAVVAVRASLVDLRQGRSAHTTLAGSLARYATEASRTPATAVHLLLDALPDDLPPDVETELSHIVREAISNSSRHAKADNLWVTCRQLGGGLEVLVEDDGVGGAGARRDHYGLQIMTERAERMGALLKVRQRAGGGTTVSVAVQPVRHQQPAARPGGDDAVHTASR